nr:Ycf15 [Reaumuria songarica]QUB07742.1 Ycf15 [Reaumuria songarica]
MGKSPIPKTDYVIDLLSYVMGGHFTRGFYCINLPLCDSC